MSKDHTIYIVFKKKKTKQMLSAMFVLSCTPVCKPQISKYNEKRHKFQLNFAGDRTESTEYTRLMLVLQLACVRDFPFHGLLAYI